MGGLKSWVLRDFWVLKCFRVLLERKEEKMKSAREGGVLFFLSRASNAAAFVTECCGIKVSDFKHISGSGLNAAALGTQCCGIEGSVSKIFFLV